MEDRNSVLAMVNFTKRVKERWQSDKCSLIDVSRTQEKGQGRNRNAGVLRVEMRF